MADAAVIFHRLAQREYDQALRWYARRSPRSAQRFQAEVQRVLQQIASAPGLGPVFNVRFRWVRTRRFPYVLYYHVLDADHVLLMAVAHSSRRPGYWLRRTHA